MLQSRKESGIGKETLQIKPLERRAVCLLCGIQEDISSEEARVSQSPQQEHRGAVTQLPGARHHPQPCQNEQDMDVNMPWQAQRPADRAAARSCSVSAASGASVPSSHQVR